MSGFEKLNCQGRKNLEVHWQVKNTDKEYEHGLNVWDRFEMKIMKDFHSLYLRCDILLLSDVFENFKNRCLENCGLCPSHYLSAQALSWDVIFNMTEIWARYLF